MSTPNTNNTFGVTSNVNLTNSVNLNLNPLDIPKDLYSSLNSWNIFQKYLQNKGYVKDPTFNKNQENTNNVIDEYNKSISNVNVMPITQDSIVAAQTFHKKNDPNVQIDGWVGSQTSQLSYPSSLIMYESIKGDIYTPINSKGFIPIIWGYKRFVVTAETQISYGKKKSITPYNLWVIYDENIHTDLQTKTLQKLWFTLNQETEISINAAQNELQRQNVKISSDSLKRKTDMKLKINTQK